MDAKKAYELLEKKRLANIAKNEAEGRTMRMQGTPLNEPTMRGSNVKESMNMLRNQGKVTNVDNTIKTTSNSLEGINPDARKSKFFDLQEKLNNPESIANKAHLEQLNAEIPKTVPKVMEEVSQVAPELKQAENAAEHSGILNKLGTAGKVLGVGALAANLAGIGRDAMAGEIGKAGAGALDTATDYIPGINTAKMALGSQSAGEGSDRPENFRQVDWSKYRALQDRLGR